MSEDDVIGKLARFTPAAVDRDALLFAAGRASVRPARVWKWAVGVLVASQLVTLGLWLRPNADVPPPAVPAVIPVVVPDDPPLALDPYSLLALTRNPDVESNTVARSPEPSRPPLTVFTRNFQP